MNSLFKNFNLMFRTRYLLIGLLLSFFMTLMLLFKQGFGIQLRSGDARNKIGSVSDAERRIMKFAHAKVQEIHKHALEKQQYQGETKILTDAFVMCDRDHSSYLVLEEAEECINKQVTLHLTRALRDNFFIFTSIDQNPRNGVVTWDEYIGHYLKQQGYDSDFIAAHLTTIKGLKRNEKESIMRDKALWTDAARSDPDSLSLDEFLSFKHPESSHATILAKVEELISVRDTDEDGSLTMEEYLEDGELSEADFREMDENGDAKLERREVLKFMDPRHPHHSRVEAVSLFAAADADKDNKVTLQELLNQSTLFATSKMVDAALSFHNEF